jgi:hypothetical protein
VLAIISRSVISVGYDAGFFKGSDHGIV